jgi:hypothetical protein
MKQIYLLLFALFIQNTVLAQSPDCVYRLTCKVVAPSGLSLRAAPSLNAKVITYAPLNAIVGACESTEGTLQVEGIEGNWRAVEFSGTKGYMFDGFLEITQYRSNDSTITDSLINVTKNGVAKADTLLVITDTSAPEPVITNTISKHPFINSATEMQLLTEAYNYCGAVESIDPGLLWYGFYLDDPKKGNGNFSIASVNLGIELSKRRLSKSLEFDITTDKAERSLFLLGLNRKLSESELQIADNSNELRIRGRQIFPGQRIDLVSQGKFTLSATGAVVSSGDCPELKDYRLLINGTRNGESYNQDVLELIGEAGQCGMPELYWYGDFTGDGLPEIILVSVYPEKNIFTLLSSRGKENLMIKEAVFTVESCN